MGSERRCENLFERMSAQTQILAIRRPFTALSIEHHNFKTVTVYNLIARFFIQIYPSKDDLKEFLFIFILPALQKAIAQCLTLNFNFLNNVFGMSLRTK